MSENGNLFVFYNPSAGGYYKNELQPIIEKWQSDHNWKVTTHVTEKYDDYSEVLKEQPLDSFDFIAASGGDGTVSLVMEAIHKLRLSLPLLIIPTGTGNLAAKNFNIPLDPLKSLDLLIENSEIGSVDLMKVNGSYRMLNAGVGFNSRLMRDTTQDVKKRYGFLAYFLKVGEALKRTSQVNFLLKIDGEMTETIRGADVFVANAGLGLNMKPIKELLNPSDGVVSVFVTRPSSVSGLMGIIRKAIKGEKRGIDIIRRYEFRKHLEVYPDKVMLVQSDGDIIGTSPLKVELIPSAIQLVIPTCETAFPGFVSLKEYLAKLVNTST